jgi:hypothetical protein
MRLSHLVPEKLTAEEVLEALFLADGRRLHYTGKDGRVRWNFFRLVEMLRPGWEAERRAAATVSLETQEDRQDDLAPSSPFAGPGAEDVPARLEGVQRLRDLETLAGLDELEQRVVAITLDLLAEEGADGRPVGGGLALGSRDHAAKLTAAGLPISHEWLRRKWAALAEKLRAVG